MFETLDDSNFVLYAARYYENSNCSGEKEFEEDLNRFRYVKRLISKYKEKNELNERLILNHLIVLYNVFYHRACTRMICFKVHQHLDCIKPFLMYLGYWGDRIEPITYDKIEIIDSDVPMDEYIIHKLRKI